MKKTSSIFWTFIVLLNLKQLTYAQNNTATPLSDAPQVLEAPATDTNPEKNDSDKIPEPPTAIESTDSTTPTSTENNATAPDFQDQTLESPSTSDSPNAETTTPTTAAPSDSVLNELSAEETTETKKTEKKITTKKSNSVDSKKVRSTDVFIQEKSDYKLNESYKTISLNDVIEQGLRQNSDQEIRNKQNELNELNWNRDYRSFWLPSLKLTLTTEEQRIGTLRSSSRESSERPTHSAAGSFGFDIGTYTVFNWGKDYALYLNNQSTYQRQKQLNEEEKKDLKLVLITDYIEVIKKKNLLKIRQDQLRRASFVYRLNKEKVNVGKTSQQDYYLSRANYLEAQNEYHASKIEADKTDDNLAYLINEKSGTKFIINENVDYKKLKITLTNALDLVKNKNSDVLNSLTTIQNNERELEVARKENLPLPKFTLNLGGYRNHFDKNTNSTRYETYEGTGAIDLVASINATWDVFGADGFMNQDKLARKRIELEISRHQLKKAMAFSEASVQSIYKNIVSLQNQLLILEARIPTVTKTIDTVLENYLDGKTRFNDYKLALDDYIQTRLMFENFTAEHAQQKLQLAKVIGIEDFPGENFEHIVTRVKGK